MYVFLRYECSECCVLRSLEFWLFDNVQPVVRFQELTWRKMVYPLHRD